MRAEESPSEYGVDRRSVLRHGAVVGMGLFAGCAAPPLFRPRFDPKDFPDYRPPVRTLTRQPGYHWFGYYDKFQFDPSDRYVLGMRSEFEHRTPRPGEAIEIGMVDLADGDRWMRLGESRAWCWQQGCMLQWRPGSDSEVVWNDIEDGTFVCRVLDVFSGRQRTLPAPIYTCSPDGRVGLGLDFARLQQMRPGYGYKGVRDAHAAERAPQGSGIYRLDLETGAREMVLSLAELVARSDPEGTLKSAKHYFNHLLCSPDGQRFIFLHRWRPKTSRFGFRTRMFTVGLDGSDLHLLDPSGHTSHFIWRDPEHILAWTRGAQGSAFYLFRDRTEDVEVVAAKAMPRNGHCTYLPDRDWILNDTYPQGPERRQQVYLYHLPTARRFELGAFHAPKPYRGEWRCDTHPRSSRDGTKVVIDSPHRGPGRQLHLIDISGYFGDGV